MRFFLFSLLLAAPAYAHPGHVSEVAGHGHWIAVAAVSAAIGIGLVMALKGRKARAADVAKDKGDEPTKA